MMPRAGPDVLKPVETIALRNRGDDCERFDESESACGSPGVSLGHGLDDEHRQQKRSHSPAHQ